MESLINFVESEFVAKKEFPKFSSGDTITVYYEIKEGEKTRTQYFKGVVIQRKGSGSTETFTIRKMSGTVGVERIFRSICRLCRKLRSTKKVRSVGHVSSTSGNLRAKRPGLKKYVRKQERHRIENALKDQGVFL